MQQQSPREHLYLSEEGQRLLRERLRVNYVQYSDIKIKLSPELEKLSKTIRIANIEQTNEIVDLLAVKKNRKFMKAINSTALGLIFCLLGIYGSYEYAQAQHPNHHHHSTEQSCISQPIDHLQN